MEKFVVNAKIHTISAWSYLYNWAFAAASTFTHSYEGKPFPSALVCDHY